ncbi:MAG: TVP38/TMEM64 family protein [Thermodesulfobacteriota bacterium]
MMEQKIVQKGAIVLGVALGIGIFYALDLQRFLTLAYLQQSQVSFAELYARQPVAVISAYMTVYVVATALSVPGAVILTLAGGAMFGLVTGTVIISFASTIGATLACLVSRFLLRDWVQQRFGERLAPINRGIEEEGGFYLFTLRLVPVFPFFLINLAMGVTRIPLVRYYWVSQLGMLPATVVYVNAGKELGKLESAAGILSPGLLFSFALLGLFPITAKKVMGWLAARRHG